MELGFLISASLELKNQGKEMLRIRIILCLGLSYAILNKFPAEETCESSWYANLSIQVITLSRAEILTAMV